MITRSDIKEQLEPGLNAVFGLAYDEFTEEWPDIFETSSSDKAFEEDVLMTGLGTAQITGEGEALNYDDMGESYIARYDHATVRLGFKITKEAVEDGLYESVSDKGSRELARSMRTTKEIIGANVLNTGFTAAGPDSVPLFSANHPLAGGGVATNTIAAADLAETSVEALSVVVSNFTDDRGKPIKVMIKKLILPPELQFDAERILGTEYRTASGGLAYAANDINAIRSMGVVSEGFCVNHYLTDPKAYFMITNAPDGMKHFRRVAMENGMEGDFDADTLRYKARERYSFGYSDWRGAVAAQGT